ncbi:hypothetical protein PC118_g17114 [Phytophthora cactorum]|uniref:Uncharacterized protein n=1 Tax=Phytophthora cactorum TaxID=29920 RepID=A0A8T1F7T5_9STRA|nr:hypothetical protein PC118_g17114 [Phytophthora cactorum]
MYQSVGARGISVNDLRIRLGDYDGDRYFTTPTGPGNLENVDIQWKSWFRFLPGLKRLDLAKIPLLSKHIVEILEAAATYCRHLEFLILPCKSDTRQTLQGSSIDKVMTTLYAAMERWYSTGGLRQLTVPSRNQSDRYHGSTEYIESVTKFCPKIEYLDGYQEVISYADVHCSEMWTISLEAWRAFNATSTEARAVFKACPALTSISIEIDCLQNNKPRTHYVNSAVYGDEFWVPVAEHCPLLESIEMMDASGCQNFNIQSISGLSNRTLTALASLKYLTLIEFCAARQSGKGIFEWLCRVTKFEGSVGPERMLGASVGGCDGETPISMCKRLAFGRKGDKFNRIDTLTLDWRPKESNRKNELFFDYVEEEPERET